MIAALNIEYSKSDRAISKFLNKIKRDKVSVELNKGRGVCLMNVTYTSYNGKVNLDKLSKTVGNNSRRILCDSRYDFPSKSGFIRFESNAFKLRLCTNMTLQILKLSNGNNIRLGIYDPQAVISDFLYNALEYCQSVTVVTDKSNLYYLQLNRALEELGATAVITSSADELSECNLIIAPCAVNCNLPIKGNTVVLTTDMPLTAVNGLVYYDYDFNMPASFAQIKPEYITDEYFCSALYTLENQYELGSIIPNQCRCGTSVQSAQSINAFLSK